MLRMPNIEVAKTIASKKLLIMHKTKGTLAPYVLTQEQERMLAAILQHRRVLILKGRQISASTLCCYVDVLVAVMNPKICVGIATIAQQQASDMLKKCKSFLLQMGIKLISDSALRITLENGSEIHAISTHQGDETQESSVGRGQAYQFLHITELPYWQNSKAYPALMATVAADTPVVIESTAKRSGDLFHRLWADKDSGYYKLFFSVNSHTAYRKAASSISDARWEELRELGATTRETAAWWHHKLREQGGDDTAMLRDFPFTDEQPFVNNASRHIKVNPVVRPHVTMPTLDTRVKLFALPPQAPRCLITCDPAAGGGNGDNAVICVINTDNREVVASWVSNVTTMLPQIELLEKLYKYYKPWTVLIEGNGMGGAWVEMCKHRGIPVHEVTTDAATKQQGLDAVKWGIESGDIYAGEELVWECENMYFNKKGQACGPKDMLMCLGFALNYLHKHGLTKPPAAENPAVYIQPTPWMDADNKPFF
jgi:hypothetical protein